MNYQTTKIKPLKSYPTYQFHAYTDSDSLSVNDVFKICVLEIFRWLRLRLNSFSELPEVLNVPEPEAYACFDEENLSTFSLDLGFSVSAVYIEKSGVWAFNISESDMGANLGTDTERAPVQGRVFSTDVALRKLKNCVEFGVRTTCSEPFDTTAECEVFRPTFVKVLAQNENVGFRHHCRLDGKVLEIATKSDTENLCGILSDDSFNMPLVLIAETDLREITPEIAEIKIPDTNNLQFSFGMGTSSFSGGAISIDLSKTAIELKKPLDIEKKKKTETPPLKTVQNTIKPEKKRSETLDYVKLAERLVGFAVVCKVSENCFKMLKNKADISIEHGDVLLCVHGKVVDEYKFEQFENRLKEFARELKCGLQRYPKRNPYVFGDMAFISDARLLEIEEKRSASLTREEQSELLKLENDELKNQLRESEQRSVDMRLNSDELRAANRRIRILESENLEAKLRENTAQNKLDQLSAAYRKTADIIDFYRKKAQDAAEFPTNKDAVCEWIENEYSDNVILAPRAKSELRKYSGALSVAMLCDGIYFLNGYALYRKGKISKEQLELYAESCGWTVEGCGKEALKVRRDDYIATVDGEKYLLDLHIKYGVNPQQLIRIYFCWDESKNKIIIGYMPGHLATVKQNT